MGHEATINLVHTYTQYKIKQKNHKRVRILLKRVQQKAKVWILEELSNPTKFPPHFQILR